jgi:hypothetical protein
MMKHLIVTILFFYLGSTKAQSQDYSVTETEYHKIAVSGSENMVINMQNAHIVIKAWSKDYIQVNIKKEAKHKSDKTKANKEIVWSKCNVNKSNGLINLSNSILLPKGIKEKPQCKHLIYLEILMPKIETVKINLNIGSLSLDNLNSEINFKTKLCKTSFNNCELKGEFHQTLGESNVNNCTLKGSFIFVNVVSKLSNIMGSLEIDATDSKINLSQQKNGYIFQWDILRSEINWVSSHSLLPNLKFEMNASSLTLPSFMQKQTSKLSYHYENRQNKNQFRLKANNSFINIYNH